ncbi:hypothetical protein AAVH_23356 [Aphelenchoides avenae]|nr:hypothetical protein AAVH_23356 [Aphelenchus avenae]
MASNGSSSGYASIEGDSSSGSSTPTASPFHCDCGRALDASGGPVILGTCGHNFCGICTGMMIINAADGAGMTWLTVPAIVCRRCDLYSSTTTLRRNDVALEVMRAAELNRDVSHTLMQQAVAKIERLRKQVEQGEASQKNVAGKLEQSAAMLQAAKKSILDERHKNAALEAKVAKLRVNIDKIGFQLKVEEGVRKQLDLKLAACERMVPRFNPAIAPPPGFENVTRGTYASMPCPLSQPPIGTGRPSHAAAPPSTASRAPTPPRITMDVECEALEMILSMAPSEYTLF